MVGIFGVIIDWLMKIKVLSHSVKLKSHKNEDQRCIQYEVKTSKSKGLIQAKIEDRRQLS